MSEIWSFWLLFGYFFYLILCCLAALHIDISSVRANATLPVWLYKEAIQSIFLQQFVVVVIASQDVERNRANMYKKFQNSFKLKPKIQQQVNFGLDKLSHFRSCHNLSSKHMDQESSPMTRALRSGDLYQDKIDQDVTKAALWWSFSTKENESEGVERSYFPGYENFAFSPDRELPICHRAMMGSPCSCAEGQLVTTTPHVCHCEHEEYPCDDCNDRDPISTMDPGRRVIMRTLDRTAKIRRTFSLRADNFRRKQLNFLFHSSGKICVENSIKHETLRESQVIIYPSVLKNYNVNVTRVDE